MSNYLKNFVNRLKTFLNSFSFWKWFCSTQLYQFVLKLINTLKTSTIAFSVFVLLGTVSFAFTRYFYMWYFDCWQYLFFFYCSVLFSFVVSILLILLHYFQNSELSARIDRNSQKWNAYYDHVIRTHDVAFIFKIKRFGGIAITLYIAICYIFFDFSVNSGLFGLLLLIWSVAKVASGYYIFITPVPNELFLEPPAFFEKICQKPIINRILLRRYASRRGSTYLFTSSKKVAIVALTTTGLVSAAAGADITLANAFDETTYIARLHDRFKYGWQTSVRDARSRMLILMELGYDSSDFIKNGRLDHLKVHRTYTEWESGFRERESILEERLATQDQEIKNLSNEVKSLSDQLNALERKEPSDNL